MHIQNIKMDFQKKSYQILILSLHNSYNVIFYYIQVDGSKKKRPLVLIRVPKDHDLVLEFDSVGERRKFINKFEAFLNSHKKHLVTLQAPRDFLLAQAETRERRQKRLEHFFREAYALTFGLRPGDRRRGDEDGDVSIKYFKFYHVKVPKTRILYFFSVKDFCNYSK